MNRRDLIKSTLMAAGAASTRGVAAPETLPSGQKPPQRKHSFPVAPRKTDGGRAPNILWVVTDQQRFDTLGGVGNPVIHTPNLDTFMTESVTFNNAFVQCPICAPSRGSFMTGRYPHTDGLRANGQRIRPTERLVSRILADQDYACALAGKLHLSPCGVGRVENRIDDGYEVFSWSHDISNSWPLQNQWVNWLRENNVPYPRPPAGYKDPVWGMPIDPKYTQTAWCCDEGIRFLRGQKNFNPWLMSVHIFQPHHPFWPTAEYLSHYDPNRMPKPAYREGELENKPIFQKIDHKGAYGGNDLSFADTSAGEHQKITAAYYAMIGQVDTDFGRLMRALEESGQADNTIVIFMSDHGEMLGDHGLYLKGPFFYDCLTRVPLIIRWPGKYKANLRLDALVELIDIAPTMVEAAGIPIPSGMQGQTLRPLLTGETTEGRDSVYTEFFDANALYETPPMAASVRTHTHKVSFYANTQSGELYDLTKDPGEFQNLWNSPQHKDIQAEMMTTLATRMIGTVDPAPERQSWW